MSIPISPLAADVIGIIGSVCFISGFAYANMTKAMNHLWFNILNLVGAVLLLISLSVHFNLAAFVLEIVWGTIAILGIGKALWERRVAQSQNHSPFVSSPSAGRKAGRSGLTSSPCDEVEKR